MHNSFGGLTSGILQELDEEYAKKSHLCFATMPAAFPEDTRWAADQRILNVILGFAKFGDFSGLLLPTSLRNSFGLKSTSVALPWIDYKVVWPSSSQLSNILTSPNLRLFFCDAFFLRTFTYVCSIRVNERVYVF